MSNQEDIISKVHGMDLRGLPSLVVEHPFFLTDDYFIDISRAIAARYAELTSDARAYYSFEGDMHSRTFHQLPNYATDLQCTP